MPEPTTAPEPALGSVRTDGPPSLVGSRCPVCQERPIRGRQTVCSGRCRARRWRQGRDRGLREALRLLRAKVDDLLARLDRRR